ADMRAVGSGSVFTERVDRLGRVEEKGSRTTPPFLIIVRDYIPPARHNMCGDKDMAPMGGEELRQLRRRVQMIFQDPFASLNPRFTIGSLISEPMHIYHIGSNKEINDRTVELLRVVGLRPEYIDRYPHEFSG